MYKYKIFWAPSSTFLYIQKGYYAMIDCGTKILGCIRITFLEGSTNVLQHTRNPYHAEHRKVKTVLSQIRLLMHGAVLLGSGMFVSLVMVLEIPLRKANRQVEVLR